jgi:hypothetical protein
MLDGAALANERRPRQNGRQHDDPTQPVLLTMPLCSFPTQARYSGNGDVNSTANWSCAANEDLLQVGANGASAGLVGPVRR